MFNRRQCTDASEHRDASHKKVVLWIDLGCFTGFNCQLGSNWSLHKELWSVQTNVRTLLPWTSVCRVLPCKQRFQLSGL
ncbi:uncharacterized protein LOC111062397 isoform X1 [Nilaparvata lugens]|uniref:uncharacterized protein LOC111062397 isoform X1 n=1 Tax=Nilaparvata lugens TaxID=108931 RepID=UPI00193D17DA|nr:uncharacterized protein LOC111062397 isoform X1 [Nilaparvata lugens]